MSTKYEVPLISALNLVALGAALKERRLMREETLVRAASLANTSRSLLGRLETGDCENINYKSLFRVIQEMNFKLYIDGIEQANPTTMAIAGLIKKTRTEKDITLRELSDLSGVLFTTIFGIENCSAYSDFSYTSAIKILDALGCSACFILANDLPANIDDVNAEIFRVLSGDPMSRSPYL